MERYAVLLYMPSPADGMDLTQEERDAHARYAAQIEEMGGKLRFPQALHPTTTATSIRGDLITDGPFVEAKEAVAGFFVLEARDLDHALKIARACPANWQGGGVEVRPIAAGATEYSTPR